jgi:hypothetical protein
MSLCVSGIIVLYVLKDYTAFIFRVKCDVVCVFAHTCVWRYIPRATCLAVLCLGLPDPKDEGTTAFQNILSCDPNETR